MKKEGKVEKGDLIIPYGSYAIKEFIDERESEKEVKAKNEKTE